MLWSSSWNTHIAWYILLNVLDSQQTHFHPFWWELHAQPSLDLIGLLTAQALRGVLDSHTLLVTFQLQPGLRLCSLGSPIGLPWFIPLRGIQSSSSAFGKYGHTMQSSRSCGPLTTATWITKNIISTATHSTQRSSSYTRNNNINSSSLKCQRVSLFSCTHYIHISDNSQQPSHFIPLSLTPHLSSVPVHFQRGKLLFFVSRKKNSGGEKKKFAAAEIPALQICWRSFLLIIMMRCVKWYIIFKCAMMRKTIMIIMMRVSCWWARWVVSPGTELCLFFPHFYYMLHVYLAYNQQYHYQIHNPYDTRHRHLFGHFYTSYKHSLFARICILVHMLKLRCLKCVYTFVMCTMKSNSMTYTMMAYILLCLYHFTIILADCANVSSSIYYGVIIILHGQQPQWDFMQIFTWLLRLCTLLTRLSS